MVVLFASNGVRLMDPHEGPPMSITNRTARGFPMSRGVPRHDQQKDMLAFPIPICMRYVRT